jgi:hypothetical protein
MERLRARICCELLGLSRLVGNLRLIMDGIKQLICR